MVDYCISSASLEKSSNAQFRPVEPGELFHKFPSTNQEIMMPADKDNDRLDDKSNQSDPGIEHERSPPVVNHSDPVRKWTLIILTTCLGLLVWHLFSDRITPYTSQARVKGYVVPITPQVAGLVKSVNVQNNQLVSKDDVLLEIDDTQYELAVQSAQATLDIAGQDVGAGTAGVKAAEANLAEAYAELERAQKSYDRTQNIYKENPGAVSKSQRDLVESSLAKAKSGVSQAEAELQKSKEQLGQQGEDNPKMRSAVAALGSARFDLSNTKVRAPTSGVVTDLRIEEGYYAQPGQPLMTFIAIHDVWIEAYFRENNLGRIKPGDPVEIALDVQPGRVYPGNVGSLSAGVSHRTSELGDLPTVEDSRGWLRDAQRFAVIVHFDESLAQTKLGRRVGSQADIIVYTGNNFILNAIGWLWIRIASIFSYAY